MSNEERLANLPNGGLQLSASAKENTDTRKCTCHPDDLPPVPCPRKFALTECRAAAYERLSRPNWRDVYGYGDTPNRDQDLVPVTREALRLALSAIKESQRRDAYHNYQAAWQEIEAALAAA